MRKKTLLIIILALMTLSIVVPSVLAYNGRGEGILGSIMGPLAGDNFVATYMKYSAFIDMIIYMVLFWGLAEWTLGAKMHGKGKMVMTGVALIMAVSLGLFEGVMGFNLITLGPLVFTILICLLAFAIYKGLTQAGMQKKYALSLCFLGAYMVIMSVVMMATSGAAVTGPLRNVNFGIYHNDTFELIVGIAGLGLIPALYFIGSWFVHKMFGGGEAPGPIAPEPGKPTPPPIPPEGGGEPPEKKKAKGEEKKVYKIAKRSEKFAELEEKEFKKAMADVIEAAKPFAVLKMPELKTPDDKKKMVADAKGKMKEAKGLLEKIARQEKMKIRLDLRAKNLAEVLKKDLEELEKQEKGVTAAALKLVEEKMTVDLKEVLAYGINFEQEAKGRIGNIDKIIEDIDFYIQHGEEENRAKKVRDDIKRLYGKMQTMEKYLLAMISLDEELKKLAVEAEAAEAKS